MESTNVANLVEVVDLTEVLKDSLPPQTEVTTTNSIPVNLQFNTLSSLEELKSNGVEMLEVSQPELNPWILKSPVSYALIGEYGGFSTEPSSEGWYNVLSAEDISIPPNGIKKCDSGVLLYINESCFMQLDVSKNADLEVKTGILDDTDCGNLNVFLKNNGKDTVFLKRGDPMARIQFNKVNFPGPNRIGKKELQDFVYQLTFSRRQRRFVTIANSIDDIPHFETTPAIPSTSLSLQEEPLDLSTLTEIQQNPFGGKRAWGSDAGNCSDDEDIDEASDIEAPLVKRKPFSSPKTKKSKLTIYMNKGNIIFN